MSHTPLTLLRFNLSCHPPTSSTPSVSVCRPSSRAPVPLSFTPPSSYSPLSCATAMHKYINLMSMCGCGCVCACMGRSRWGMPTYRRWAGNPTGRSLSCVTRSQTLSVYTLDQSRHTTPSTRPLHQSQQKLVTQTEEAWGQRLGVNLVVVMVPDWLSNLITLPLTKCEIQPVVTGQSGYKKVS